MDMHCKADPFSAMHREYWSPAPSAALPPVPPSLRPSPPVPAQPRSPCPLPAAPAAPPRAPGTRRLERPRAAPGRPRKMRRYPSLLLFLSLSIAVPGAGAARDLSWMRNPFFFSSGFGGVWLRFWLSVADRQRDGSSTLTIVLSWRLRAPVRGVRLKAEMLENGARWCWEPGGLGAAQSWAPTRLRTESTTGD